MRHQTVPDREALKVLPVEIPKDVVAVLSATVLPLDGVYMVDTVYTPEQAGVYYFPANLLKGMPHYIGHPDTARFVENLGARPSECKLFAGLQPGEKAVVVSLAPGVSLRAKEGFSAPHVRLTEPKKSLTVRIVERIASQRIGPPDYDELAGRYIE